MTISTAENLCFLLWRIPELTRDCWADTAGEWLNCRPDQALCYLRGDRFLDPDQVYRLQELAGYRYTEHDIQYERLVLLEDVDILLENISYLTARLHGVRLNQLAAAIGVSPVTLSRWRTSEQRPHRANLIALARYFNLSRGADLRVDAIFLSPEPVHDMQKRLWLQKRINTLSMEELDAMFPALEKLLA